MRNLLLTLLLSSTTMFVFAQAPQKMTYQAVIRDASDALVTNSPIGVQISILQTSATGIAVYIERHTPTTNTNGLVTLEIGTGTIVSGNFSAIDWSQGPYFIKSETDLNGGTSYTISGTTELLSVPYALYAGNSFSGDYNDLTNTPTNVSSFTNDAGYITSAGLNTLNGAYNQGGPGLGRTITANSGEVDITTSTPNGIALRTTNSNTGVAIIATSTNATNTFSTIQATTNANSNLASAIVGSSSGAAFGVSGQVESTGTATAGVYGSNLRTTGGHGVYGIGVNGLVGETNYSQGNAVWGENYDQIAPIGNGAGVAGKGYYGVIGEDRYLGGVAGAYGVVAIGDMGATGVKTFMIDHPMDPENKILRHFSTESNEVLNIYRGNVTFDSTGTAVVQLPEYYDAINKNPSYHLTPIGGYAQLFILQEIGDGFFIIGGGTPGLKASWTVYAERNDLYLQQYPEKREAVIEKREGQKGFYFIPQLYNLSTERAIFKSPNNGVKTRQQLLQLKQ